MNYVINLAPNKGFAYNTSARLERPRNVDENSRATKRMMGVGDELGEINRR